jgi:hypothetical protein
LAERYSKPAELYLLGGGGLCLLGSPRRTYDIDYTVEGSSDQAQELIATIEALADEMELELEEVPLEEFIPLPQDANKRHLVIGQFGSLTVYVYDPYSIAISKLSRGLKEDVQDVIFLWREKMINLNELAKHIQTVLPFALQFDIDPADLRLYFNEMVRMYAASLPAPEARQGPSLAREE